MEDVNVTFLTRFELEALFCISTNQQKFVISETAAVFIYRSTETGFKPIGEKHFLSSVGFKMSKLVLFKFL